MTQTFELKTPSLSEQKITEQLKNILSLTDKALQWDVEFYCEELNDKTEIWEKDVLNSYYAMFMKESISGIQIGNSKEEEGVWELEIFQMSGHKITIHFESEKQVREIGAKIMDWRLQ